jgi:peroxiredoxin
MPDLTAQIEELNRQLQETEQRLTELKRQWGAADVQDFVLQGPDGPVRLSEAFAGHEYMVLIHNMGRNCPYCTLWADGFSSLARFIEEGVPGGSTRAAFVVISPDTPGAQQEFAQSRGWKFRMLSDQGAMLARELGYADQNGALWPGVSILKREAGQIHRVARDNFGPGDKYNAVFSFFQLIPDTK